MLDFKHAEDLNTLDSRLLTQPRWKWGFQLGSRTPYSLDHQPTVLELTTLGSQIKISETTTQPYGGISTVTFSPHCPFPPGSSNCSCPEDCAYNLVFVFNLPQPPVGYSSSEAPASSAGAGLAEGASLGGWTRHSLGSLVSH